MPLPGRLSWTKSGLGLKVMKIKYSKCIGTRGMRIPKGTCEVHKPSLTRSCDHCRIMQPVAFKPMPTQLPLLNLSAGQPLSWARTDLHISKPFCLQQMMPLGRCFCKTAVACLRQCLRPTCSVMLVPPLEGPDAGLKDLTTVRCNGD